MIDFLISIPGPQFIILFILYTALCIFVAWYAHNNDESQKYLLPPITAFDGYTLAMFRGGWKAVLECALYGLWKRELIDLNTTSHFFKGSLIEAHRIKNKNASLNFIERTIYNFFHDKKNLQKIFEDVDVKTAINGKMESAVQELQARHLLKNPTNIGRSYFIAACTLLAIYLIGGTKLYYGLMRGRPTEFLMFILIFIPLIVFLVLKPARRQTALGISYLDSLKEKFDWMREKALHDDLNGIDPVHIAAIYGVAAVSTNSAFADAVNRQSSNNAGGCGSSGCGGGGCGGGGCGGGCGGCGG